MSTSTMTIVEGAPAAAASAPTILVLQFATAKKVETTVKGLVESLYRSTCLDTAAKQEIVEWERIFSQKFPHAPKENDQRWQAVTHLCFLLFNHIKPMKVHAEKEQHEKWMHALVADHLPQGALLEKTLQIYQRGLERKQLRADYDEMHREVEKWAEEAGAGGGEKFDALKVKLQGLIEQTQKREEALHGDLVALQKRVHALAQRQLALAEKQSKMGADLNQLLGASTQVHQQAQTL